MDRTIKASSPEGPPLKGLRTTESPEGLAEQTSKLTLSARMRRAVSDPRHHRVNPEVRLPHLGPRRESALSKVGEMSSSTSEEAVLPTLLYDSPLKKQGEDIFALPRPTLTPQRRSRTTSGVISPPPISGLPTNALPRPQLRSSSTRTSVTHTGSASSLPRPSLSQRSTGISTGSSGARPTLKSLRNDSEGSLLPSRSSARTRLRDELETFKKDERMF